MEQPKLWSARKISIFGEWIKMVRDVQCGRAGWRRQMISRRRVLLSVGSLNYAHTLPYIIRWMGMCDIIEVNHLPIRGS